MDELHSLFATRGQGNVKQHYAHARGPEGAMIVTTTNDVTGYRVTQHLGVVRGLTVRSRSIIGNIGAGIQSLFGGNITIYTELAERAREDAFNLMVEHAASAAPTPSSPCATTPTRSPTASPRCWPMVPPWWSSGPEGRG
jgi:hypothetical protein